MKYETGTTPVSLQASRYTSAVVDGLWFGFSGKENYFYQSAVKNILLNKTLLSTHYLYKGNNSVECNSYRDDLDCLPSGSKSESKSSSKLRFSVEEFESSSFMVRESRYSKDISQCCLATQYEFK